MITKESCNHSLFWQIFIHSLPGTIVKIRIILDRPIKPFYIVTSLRLARDMHLGEDSLFGRQSQEAKNVKGKAGMQRKPVNDINECVIAVSN